MIFIIPFLAAIKFLVSTLVNLNTFLRAPSPTNCDQYIILSDADNVEMETGSGQDEDDDDEIDGDGPARGGKQSFSLHSFIFGCPDPSADEEEEEEQDGRMEEDQWSLGSELTNHLINDQPQQGRGHTNRL